eukprot:5649685-Pyramimonas_sp.AAC.1
MVLRIRVSHVRLGRQPVPCVVVRSEHRRARVRRVQPDGHRQHAGVRLGVVVLEVRHHVEVALRRRQHRPALRVRQERLQGQGVDITSLRS